MLNSKGSKTQLDWPTRVARLAPWYLFLRYPNRTTRSVFTAVGGTVAIGIMCIIATLTDQPMIFPSLGPSAFLFFTRPLATTSAPRNAILAHGWGVVIGAISFWLSTLLISEPSTMTQVVTASCSLGAISAVMIFFKIDHPPAASTTLIMSLGLITEPTSFLAVMFAVVILTYLAVGINRLTGISCPLWRANSARATDDIVTTALETESARSRGTSPYSALADHVIEERGK